MSRRLRLSALLGPANGVFVGSFGTRLLVLGVGFLTSVTLARFFGPVPVAQLSLLVSLLVVTSHLSLFGSQNTLLKRLPEVDDDPDATARTLGTAVLLTLVFGLLVGAGLLGLILSGWLASYADQLGRAFVLFLPLAVLFNAFRILSNETLRGLHRVGAYNAATFINAGLLLFVVLAFWLLGRQEIQMPWVILAIEAMGILVAVTWLFAGARGLGIRFPAGWRPVRAHLRLSTIYFLSSSSILVGQIDILVAGGIVPLEQLGFYAIAVRITSLAGLVLISANISFAPRLSAVFNEEGLAAAIAFGQSQTRMLVPITVAIGAMLALAGYPILMLFGPGFVEAHPALLVLLVGQVGVVFFGPVGVFMNMSFGHREMVFVTVLELSVAFIGSLILIPRFGIIGAAMANSAAQLTRGLSATAFLYWRTGTAITIFHALRRP